jgi:hypothetical protein
MGALSSLHHHSASLQHEARSASESSLLRTCFFAPDLELAIPPSFLPFLPAQLSWWPLEVICAVLIAPCHPISAPIAVVSGVPSDQVLA